MTEPSLWDREEEEDVVLWRYSKHIAASEGPERKRSSVFADTSSLVACTTQPSMATKSTFNMTGDSLDRSGRKNRLGEICIYILIQAHTKQHAATCDCHFGVCNQAKHATSR